MLYFLYGEGKDKARAKSQEMIAILQKKKPDAAFFKLTTESFKESDLEELIGGQGLFENKYIVLVDCVFENKEFKEVLIAKLKEIAASENIFIFLEGSVDKKTLEKIEKAAEKMQIFSAGEQKEKKEDFNIFALADAFGSRDRKKLWVLYQKAIMRNAVSEEIHGILFWQWKSMILSEKSKTAGEAGLNPYVFQKSKSFAKNFKEKELHEIGNDLVAMYHDSHRGLHDFPTALENFILTL